MAQLAPQRWQDTPSAAVQKHDVVIAFEERIYDAVIEDLQTREPTEDFKAIHVICLDTKVRTCKRNSLTSFVIDGGICVPL